MKINDMIHELKENVKIIHNKRPKGFRFYNLVMLFSTYFLKCHFPKVPFS
jgi:hypothetical protein